MGIKNNLVSILIILLSACGSGRIRVGTDKTHQTSTEDTAPENKAGGKSSTSNTATSESSAVDEEEKKKQNELLKKAENLFPEFKKAIEKQRDRKERINSIKEKIQQDKDNTLLAAKVNFGEDFSNSYIKPLLDNNKPEHVNIISEFLADYIHIEDLIDELVEIAKTTDTPYELSKAAWNAIKNITDSAKKVQEKASFLGSTEKKMPQDLKIRLKNKIDKLADNLKYLFHLDELEK